MQTQQFLKKKLAQIVQILMFLISMITQFMTAQAQILLEQKITIPLAITQNILQDFQLKTLQQMVADLQM